MSDPMDQMTKRDPCDTLDGAWAYISNRLEYEGIRVELIAALTIVDQAAWAVSCERWRGPKKDD